jgi:phosphate transport system substrate-binding protein
MNTKNILAVLLAAGMAWACKSETNKDGKPLDTPTTGEITVGVDESFEPLLRSEVEGFSILYKQATIKT